MNGKQHSHIQQRGSISLMALLIMLAISGIAISIAVVVLGEVEATQDFSSSLNAYYAAETGIERSLDIVADRRLQKNVTLNTTLQDVQKTLVSSSMTQTFSQNNALYKISLASNQKVDTIQFNVGKNQTEQIDIYDPDNPLTKASVESIKINWQDTCNGLSWIELRATEWAQNWTDVTLNATPTNNFFYTCHFSNSTPPAAANECAATSNILDNTKSYSLRIKNTGECAIQDASVQIFSADNAQGTQKTFASQIAVESEGSSGRTKQILSATLPWQAPVSGLLDFVLFSEKPIEK